MISYCMNVWNSRIIDMMAEYDISVKEAIRWDMGGFGYSIENLPEQKQNDELHAYLFVNGFSYDERAQISSVFFGRQDYTLQKK